MQSSDKSGDKPREVSSHPKDTHLPLYGIREGLTRQEGSSSGYSKSQEMVREAAEVVLSSIGTPRRYPSLPGWETLSAGSGPEVEAEMEALSAGSGPGVEVERDELDPGWEKADKARDDYSWALRVQQPSSDAPAIDPQLISSGDGTVRGDATASTSNPKADVADSSDEDVPLARIVKRPRKDRDIAPTRQTDADSSDEVPLARIVKHPRRDRDIAPTRQTGESSPRKKGKGRAETSHEGRDHEPHRQNEASHPTDQQEIYKRILKHFEPKIAINLYKQIGNFIDNNKKKNTNDLERELNIIAGSARSLYRYRELDVESIGQEELLAIQPLNLARLQQLRENLGQRWKPKKGDHLQNFIKEYERCIKLP